MLALALSTATSRAPDLPGVLDRLQYHSRVESARRLLADVRDRGIVPALIDAGGRFGAANRALLGR